MEGIIYYVDFFVYRRMFRIFGILSIKGQDTFIFCDSLECFCIFRCFLEDVLLKGILIVQEFIYLYIVVCIIWFFVFIKFQF